MNKKELKKLPKIYHWVDEAKELMNEPISITSLGMMLAIGFRDAFMEQYDKDGIYHEDCEAWLRDSELFLIAANLKELSKPTTFGMLHRKITSYLYEKIEEHIIEHGKTPLFPFSPSDDNLNYRVGRWMEEYFRFMLMMGKYYFSED
jgi:hypothetical protein